MSFEDCLTNLEIDVTIKPSGNGESLKVFWDGTFVEERGSYTEAFNLITAVANGDIDFDLPKPDEELAKYLNPKNGIIAYTGNEKGEERDNGLSIFKGEFGSTRIILKKKGVALGVIQTVTVNGKTNVANIYVLPHKRRQGLATQLFNAATLVLGEITHSDHQSDDAKFWIASLS